MPVRARRGGRATGRAIAIARFETVKEAIAERAVAVDPAFRRVGHRYRRGNLLMLAGFVVSVDLPSLHLWCHLYRGRSAVAGWVASGVAGWSG